ncbi:MULTISPECIES: ExeM/NucH family extracellular endonuclease [Mumia]|uniref:ExeM/NucH family extracellular endonuclease n=1 Tax=Mumia xiangluensis TaxID=1678900 RepID=A0ABW1QKR9_9ACTN|nr:MULTISPECIES: ExeM/NucH family extracellular endonuclease [Mumia]
MSRSIPRVARATSLLAAGALAAGTLGAVAAAPASAVPADHLVINEAYLNGGSAGATYLNKFVELYNPTSSPIEVDGWTVQYRSYSSTTAFTGKIALTGTIPAGAHYLVSGNANSTNGAALPTPDAPSTIAFSGNANGGTLALTKTADTLTGDGATVVANPNVVDLLGYGVSNTSETAPVASGYSVTASVNRTDGTDTNNNSADFTSAAPTPTACGEACVPTPNPVEERTIAEIQGTGAASPYDGDTVITQGVVTAAYPTGGFNGFYLQTAGSGGAGDATPGTSDGIFVFGSAAVAKVAVGDHVELTGVVSEFGGMTEITPAAADVVVLDEPAEAVKATELALPLGDAAREALEGMLVTPKGPFTVTNNYTTNTFAELGLAVGDSPLYVPTEVAAPGAASQAVDAENATKRITLDDGSSTNYTAGGKNTPQPWIDADTTIRVGASATFVKDVVLDYRNSAWKLQPTAQLTADDANDVLPATFAGAERPQSAPEVGGDFTLAAFNVLNYFITTGEEYEATTGISCEYFVDRDGVPTTVDECVGQAGPRGAASTVQLERQEKKIVAAINALGADVVSLEEIENSVKFGKDRDAALAALTEALNEAAGAGTWAYAPSPDASALPPVAEQDFIRTAFIYKPAVVAPVGASTVLVGDPAFADAREPLAQAFQPVAGTEDDRFVAIVNHFKSKRSGTPDPDQGAGNVERVAQAHALVAFADTVKAAAGTDKVYLTGDLNSYSKEDPITVLRDAGYVDLEETYETAETYQFDGEIGSLDHVFASPAAAPDITGMGVWSINAMEPIAYEYSRYNNNATLFYDETAFRSSDHDPALVGIALEEQLTPTTVSAVATPGISPLFGPIIAAQVKPRATGTVQVLKGDTVLASQKLVLGVTVVAVPAKALKPGTHQLTVRYTGDATHAASETTVTARVLGR